jgi:hypothetical protein
MAYDPFSDKAAEQFMGGGGIGQKFPEVGFKWGGTLESWEMAQQTDLDTGELKFWNDGKPRMQLIMDLQGDPTGKTWEWLSQRWVEKPIPDDDGSRRLFVKAGLHTAIVKAMKAASGKLEAGAYIEITRGEDLPPKKRGHSGQHTYTAVWTPASKNPHAAAAKFLDDEDVDPFAPKEAPF